MANANSTNSEPSTKVRAKVPRRAPTPTTAQAMVTIVAILLVNNTVVPSSKLLHWPPHILYNTLSRRARKENKALHDAHYQEDRRGTKKPGPEGPGLGTSLLTLLRRRSGNFGGIVLDLPRDHAAFCLSSSACGGRSRWSRSR